MYRRAERVFPHFNQSHKYWMILLHWWQKHLTLNIFCYLIKLLVINYYILWHVRLHATKSIYDLFQPKMDLFSTRALIWVHFKTVRYFSQPIFRSFSYWKNALHNLVIELCSALIFFKNNLQLYINFTHSFVAIELLAFCKNAKKLFYCSKELSLFWPNK